MKKTIPWMIIMSFCFVSLPASAYFSFGARAMGMGGAFSAVADGALAIYWNPAAIAIAPGWSVDMEFGDETSVADDVQDALDMATTHNPWDEEFQTDVAAALKTLGGSSWIDRGGQRLGFAASDKGFAMAVFDYDILYVTPEIDLLHLGTDAGSQEHITNNDSYLQFSGFNVKEYAFGYSFFSEQSAMALGIVGKYMDVKGYLWKASLWDISTSDAGDLLDMVTSGEEESDSSWGMDVGLLFLGRYNRFAVVGRNIISQDIELRDDLKLKIKPEYRIGYAFFPNDRFIFSMDYALQKDRFPNGDKYDGKMMSMGFEGKLGEKKWFLLRGGVSYDMSGDGQIQFSGGIGFVFKHVIFDGGAAMDSDGEGRRLWSGLRFRF